jgi:hypothetical protein
MNGLLFHLKKPLIIVKLEKVTDVVGLKSPKPLNKSKTEN